MRHIHRNSRFLLCALTIMVASLTQRPSVADDTPKQSPADIAASAATPAPASHLTSSLRVPRRSVSVVANPLAPKSASSPHASGLVAYLDADGNITATPPPGLAPQTLAVPRWENPPPITSAADPNAIGFDTSHIVAITSARITADGRIETDCRENSQPATAGHHERHLAPAPAQPVKSSPAEKEAGR